MKKGECNSIALMALLRRAATALSSGHLMTEKDIVKLEEVQRRGTEITRLKGLVWKRRLRELNMDNLVQRQLCGDTVIIYKHMRDENIKRRERNYAG